MTDEQERHRHLVQDAYHRADAMEHGDTYGDTPAALRRLADELDRLRVENERLREALRDIIHYDEHQADKIALEALGSSGGPAYTEDEQGRKTRIR